MASPVDTSVKFFSEKFPSAPVLNGVVGALIPLLDACLVDGFGSRTPTSVTVSGGVATINTATEVKNLNMVHSVILFAGATGTHVDLNGEQKITGATTTTLTFATALADGTVAGTLTFMTAPAGWAKVYSGTDKAAYASIDPAGTGMRLRVVDDAATEAKVRGYVSMSDIDTGTGPFPTVAAKADSGTTWKKSTGSNSTANPWDLFADSRTFYFCPMAAFQGGSSQVGQSVYMYGDLKEYRSLDPYCAALTSTATSDSTGEGGNLFLSSQNQSSNGSAYLARSYTGLGDAVVGYFGPQAAALNSLSLSGSDTAFNPFPSPVDGSLQACRMWGMEGANAGSSMRPRGDTPGTYYMLNSGNAGSVFFRHAEMDFEGRVVRAINPGAWDAIQNSQGVGFFDVTGPWREI